MDRNSVIPFVSEPPTIRIYGDVAHVWDRSGSMGSERAMSISSFVKFIERGQRALRRRAAGDEVIIVDD